MKQRILVAIIGVPALIGVLCFAPDWATAVLVAALCVIGCHEFMAAAAPEKAAHWWGLAATLAAAESPAVARMASLTSLSASGAGSAAEAALSADSGLVSLSVRPVRYQLPLWRLNR